VSVKKYHLKNKDMAVPNIKQAGSISAITEKDTILIAVGPNKKPKQLSKAQFINAIAPEVLAQLATTAITGVDVVLKTVVELSSADILALSSGDGKEVLPIPASGTAYDIVSATLQTFGSGGNAYAGGSTVSIIDPVGTEQVTALTSSAIFGAGERAYTTNSVASVRLLTNSEMYLYDSVALTGGTNTGRLTIYYRLVTL